MPIAGVLSLAIAFVAIVLSIGLLIVGKIITGAARGENKEAEKKFQHYAEQANSAGHYFILLTGLALTVGCGILVCCFVTGDLSLEYVVHYRSNATGPLRLLFEVSGLWGGREGSLLFWTWLISLFAIVVALRNLKHQDKLDNMALVVIQIVILAFVVVLLFSDSNMPFQPLDPRYLNPDGSLKTFNEMLLAPAEPGAQPLNAKLVQGMNIFLEHWAMAIHPPTLFIGYAGLTVPFAYAVAALIVNDPSKKWVARSRRYALVSWVFLGLGIGLGAIWAYVVLGWGGYWGWDPVENASLLSWILAVALVHSLTVYRQRGAFKRWAVMCACLAFAFVIVGTFITRSGVVQNSVHTFEGDRVSLYLFPGLIVASLLAGAIGLAVRWKSFAEKSGAPELGDSFFSKGVAYYFNNVILVISALILVYLTLTSALPSWMPYGGLALSSNTFQALARPLTVLYCLIMAVCPLLSWAKTDWQAFLKKSLVPGIGALVVFVLLIIYFIVYLKPSYDATMAAGGSFAQTRLEGGAPLYYFFMTIIAFLAASLLFFNSLVMLGAVIREQAKASGASLPVALVTALRERASRFGGFLAHLSIAVILVGLIGSSMYTTQVSGYIPFDEDSDTASEEFMIQDYRLVFERSDIRPDEKGTAATFTMHFDAYKQDRHLGRISPSVYLILATQERKAEASIIGMPLEDLFVVYNGLNENNETSLTAWVNPLISFVWAGFVLLMAGTVIAAAGRQRVKPKDREPIDREPNENG